MVLCLLLLTALASSGFAADTPAPQPAANATLAAGGSAPGVAATPAPRAGEPTPAPGGGHVAPLDAVTSHRAEQAADAYLRAQAEHDGRPDPEAEHALASAEVELLEAQTYFDLKQPLKAGERYLEASKLLAAIAADQRAALGARLRRASATLTALSRRLLDDKAFDPGTPEPAGAPASAPASAPAGPPATH
jgi:hypothetical protein